MDKINYDIVLRMSCFNSDLESIVVHASQHLMLNDVKYEWGYFLRLSSIKRLCLHKITILHASSIALISALGFGVFRLKPVNMRYSNHIKHTHVSYTSTIREFDSNYRITVNLSIVLSHLAHHPFERTA